MTNRKGLLLPAVRILKSSDGAADATSAIDKESKNGLRNSKIRINRDSVIGLVLQVLPEVKL